MGFNSAFKGLQFDENRPNGYLNEDLCTFVLVKGKAVAVRAWTGPESYRRLRLPDFMTIGI